jgi:hypothetical protein
MSEETTNVETVENNLENRKQEILATLEINLDAYNRLSVMLGKKGTHRVVNAALRYPQATSSKLMDETELSCFTLLVDILKARFTLSLIEVAEEAVAEKTEQDKE